MRLLLVSTAAALSVPGTHQRPIRIAPGLEVTVLEADEGKPGGVHTGTVTWSGGRALAGYLSENAHLVRGKRVAEIGCGCGLVSLTCCALGADAVLATDVEAAEEGVLIALVLVALARDAKDAPGLGLDTSSSEGVRLRAGNCCGGREHFFFIIHYSSQNFGMKCFHTPV